MAVSLPTVKHVCYALVRSLVQTLVITRGNNPNNNEFIIIIDCVYNYSKDLIFLPDLEFADACTRLTIHALTDFNTVFDWLSVLCS